MKKSTVVVSTFSFVIAAALMMAASTSHAADGKQLFLDQKCNKCHSITAKKIDKVVAAAAEAPAEAGEDSGPKPPDLSDVKFSAADLKPFLKKEKELTIEGKSVKHKKAVTLPDADLDALIAFVLSK